MSDKTRKEAASPAATKGPKQQSKLLSKLRTIAGLCREIEKDDSEIIDYESLSAQVRELKDQVQSYKALVVSRDGKIAALQKEKEDMAGRHRAEKATLMNTFAEQASTWKEATRQNQDFQEDIRGLKQAREKAQTEIRRLSEYETRSNNLSSALQASRAHVAALTEERKKLRDGLDLTRRNLEAYSADLKKLDEETGVVELSLSQMYVHVLVSFV